VRNALPAADFYARVRDILESARGNIARSVNTTQVVANWLIGREIVEEEQRGQKRAEYGKALLTGLSAYLQAEFGRGYSVDNLEWFRAFYVRYPGLLEIEKSDAARRILSDTGPMISDAARRKSAKPMLIGHAARGQSWRPGRLHPNLSWTHYRTLLRVEKPEARAFYRWA
jgi:hypothetical protein